MMEISKEMDDINSVRGEEKIMVAVDICNDDGDDRGLLQW